MDKQQQRRMDAQHPLSARSPVKTDSRGGRFVAHGLRPATFQPIPKTAPIGIPATAKPHGPWGQAVRLTKLQRNNELQARERPTGFVAGTCCSWCWKPFDDQRLFSAHRNACPHRPGGPIARDVTPGPKGFATPEIACVCECGLLCRSRTEKRRHFGSGECPLSQLPGMCWMCGARFSNRPDAISHQWCCCREGAD